MTESSTWSIRLLRAALKLQDSVAEVSAIIDETSPSLRKVGSGRKAHVVIEGEDGGETYLRWTGDRLLEELEPDGARNDFILHSQTLFDMATGELRARDALAARLVVVTGDRSIYDQEDIIKLFEKMQDILVNHLKSRGI